MNTPASYQIIIFIISADHDADLYIYTYIYVDTDNSSGQNKIPCRTPQSDNKEKPREHEEYRGDNLLNDWSVY